MRGTHNVIVLFFFIFIFLFSISLVAGGKGGGGPGPLDEAQYCPVECIIDTCVASGALAGWTEKYPNTIEEYPCVIDKSCQGNDVLVYVTGSGPSSFDGQPRDPNTDLCPREGGNKRNNYDCEYVQETCSGRYECQSGACVYINECEDGIDNDGDGLIDAEDPNCWVDPTDPNTYQPGDDVEVLAPQCSDGSDNDGDGLRDAEDPDCWFNDLDSTTYDSGDTVESPATTECSDGLDNDGDGLRDMEDPNCWEFYDDMNSYDPNIEFESKQPVCYKGCDAFWTNANLEQITDASKNSLVKLVVSGNRIENQDVKYEIYRDVKFWFDNKITDSDTRGFASWRAGMDDNGVFTPGDFYFRAKVGSQNWVSTKDAPNGILHVTATETNAPPVTNIDNPVDRGIYFLNEEVPFVQSSFDVDDEFTYVWDIGDGVKKIGDSITKANYAFTHIYNTTGQKNILLTVTDDRGEVSKDQSSILIVDDSSRFILSYIDEPKFGEVYGRTVLFNATSTYAIDANIDAQGVRSFDCISGYCPDTTVGCPPEYDQSLCPIAITNAPASQADANYDDITFNWSFDGGTVEGYLKKGNLGTMIEKSFLFIGRHVAHLNAMINPESNSQVTFDVFFDK